MTTDTPVIEVTDSAAEKLCEVLEEQDKSAGLLRIMVMRLNMPMTLLRLTAKW